MRQNVSLLDVLSDRECARVQLQLLFCNKTETAKHCVPLLQLALLPEDDLYFDAAIAAAAAVTTLRFACSKGRGCGNRLRRTNAELPLPVRRGKGQPEIGSMTSAGANGRPKSLSPISIRALARKGEIDSAQGGRWSHHTPVFFDGTSFVCLKICSTQKYIERPGRLTMPSVNCVTTR